ncbi:hypothetical protein P9112_005215 [Eukaryota sp. TZLM1-RC]
MDNQINTPPLHIYSDFESGNIETFTQCAPYEYDIFIRSDPRPLSKLCALWFHFAVDFTTPSLPILFNIIGTSKTKSNYRSGQTPIIKPSNEHTYYKVHPKNVFYYKCPRHDNSYTLSFLFSPPTASTYFFSYSFPYTYTHLQHFLSSIPSFTHPLHRSLLCRSLLLRRIDLLSSDPPSSSSLPYPVIFISARAHPGETPSSLLCEGLVEYLCSSCSNRLRSLCGVRVVPMLNPDGVANGNYRTDVLGFDYNRCWEKGRNSIYYDMLSPIKYFTDLVMSSINDPYSFPAFSLDLHSHSFKADAFIFGNKVNVGAENLVEWKNLPRQLKEKLIPNEIDIDNVNFYLKFQTDSFDKFSKVLGSTDRTFNPKFCRFTDPASDTLMTQRKILGELLSPYGGHAQTLEVSSALAHNLDNIDPNSGHFNGHIPQFSRSAYKSLGWSIGMALDEYVYDKYVVCKMARKFWQRKE